VSGMSLRVFVVFLMVATTGARLGAQGIPTSAEDTRAQGVVQVRGTLPLPGVGAAAGTTVTKRCVLP